MKTWIVRFREKMPSSTNILLALLAIIGLAILVKKNVITPPLFAQTSGTRAVIFVIGNNCPSGFSDTNAAGYGDWNGFYVRFSDTGAAAPVDSGLTTSTDGYHGHTQDTCVHGIGGGGPVPVACAGGGTSGAGSHNHTYEPKYVYLKPCVWNVN